MANSANAWCRQVVMGAAPVAATLTVLHPTTAPAAMLAATMETAVDCGAEAAAAVLVGHGQKAEAVTAGGVRMKRTERSQTIAEEMRAEAVAARSLMMGGGGKADDHDARLCTTEAYRLSCGLR
mmetsp:Transcript_76967/g.152427  ORF Transcript_76967/g.152427 Transcript_76967/m.152427 type:complete len:124 (-) Transcript_76967:99-470(-)